MASTKDLEAQVQRLTDTLERLGIRMPAEVAIRPEDRADYIAFGSPEHAAFLGLVELESEDEAAGRITYRSPRTEKLYCLEDEVTPFMHHPDPKQVAGLVLRQKVNELEAGAPEAPADAPPLWVPVDQSISGTF